MRRSVRRAVHIGVPGTQRGVVTILGGGVAGINAAKMAIGLGAHVNILELNEDRIRYLEDIFKNDVTVLKSNIANIEKGVTEADVLISTILTVGAKAKKIVTEDMVRQMKKGSIIIALIFIMVLSLTIIAFLTMLGGKTHLVTKQLKRQQAIYCAEMAIYSVFDRIRIGAEIPQGLTKTVPVPLYTSGSNTVFYTVPVIVTFTGSEPPYKVEARVAYDDIRM